MVRNILVEGPECSGKTTLVERLRHSLHGWDSKHLAHRAGNQFDRYLEEYVNNKNVIFNRGHVSEIVYSRLWGRNCFSESEVRVLDSVAGNSMLVVFCRAGKELIRKRYLERNFSQKINIGEIDNICAGFEAAFKNVEFVEYLSSDWQALDSVVEKIISVVSGTKCLAPLEASK